MWTVISQCRNKALLGCRLFLSSSIQPRLCPDQADPSARIRPPITLVRKSLADFLGDGAKRGEDGQRVMGNVQYEHWEVQISFVGIEVRDDGLEGTCFRESKRAGGRRAGPVRHPHLTSPHLTSPHLTSPHFTPLHVHYRHLHGLSTLHTTQDVVHIIVLIQQ